MDEARQPTFSIITASFRQMPWLKLCAASVADQLSVSYEHIIQDGGSDPEMPGWTSPRHFIRCFQEPDEGMYDALNRGLQRARGRLLGWLNCDEQYLPGTLQRVEHFFSANPEVDVLFGDAILVDIDGQPLSYRRVVPPNRIHLRLGHLGTHSCATFFRRSIVDRGLLFDTQWRSIGDAVWMDALLENRVLRRCIREPLAVYTFTGANLSASEVGRGEMRRWRNQPDAPARWLHVPAVLWHRLRKLAAGAYMPRGLRYAIYTNDSPSNRVVFDTPAIHYGWPGETAPPPRLGGTT